jgi:hypothetical protein
LETDAGPVALGARAFDLLMVLLDERGYYRNMSCWTGSGRGW